MSRAFAPQFSAYNLREKSFSSKWPHLKPNIQSLALAGFFSAGDHQEPDLVNCFFCGKALDNWEEEDIPWKEHLEHSSGCQWARAIGGPKWWMVCTHQPWVEEDPTTWPSSPSMTKAREATFDGVWPHQGKRGFFATINRMAKAGFCYTPQCPGEDLASCAYCDLTFKVWNPKDNPLIIHKEKSPDCPFFVRKAKPRENKARASAKRDSIILEKRKGPATRKVRLKEKNLAPKTDEETRKKDLKLQSIVAADSEVGSNTTDDHPSDRGPGNSKKRVASEDISVTSKETTKKSKGRIQAKKRVKTVKEPTTRECKRIHESSSINNTDTPNTSDGCSSNTFTFFQESQNLKEYPIVHQEDNDSAVPAHMEPREYTAQCEIRVSEATMLLSHGDPVISNVPSQTLDRALITIEGLNSLNFEGPKALSLPGKVVTTLPTASQLMGANPLATGLQIDPNSVDLIKRTDCDILDDSLLYDSELRDGIREKLLFCIEKLNLSGNATIESMLHQLGAMRKQWFRTETNRHLEGLKMRVNSN